MKPPARIERVNFNAQELVDSFAPEWYHPNKLVVYGISCPAGSKHTGNIGYSRWNAAELPAQVNLNAIRQIVEPVHSFYEYQPAGAGADSVKWHVNFADPELFVAYGSGLFAQDEMQVAEHPALGSLVEALRADGYHTVTVEDFKPTPVLVTGVERRVKIDTLPREGSPGLYGNNFAAASAAVVRNATTPIRPPTLTNLIAMAAPGYGEGFYSSDEIGEILVTAFTGFSAAAIESRALSGGQPAVVINTGYWGCGAFGGNRVLMAALQVIAAHMAGITRLRFHTGSEPGAAELTQAIAFIEKAFVPLGIAETFSVCARVASEGFRWGVSDGN